MKSNTKYYLGSIYGYWPIMKNSANFRNRNLVFCIATSPLGIVWRRIVYVLVEREEEAEPSWFQIKTKKLR